jgi:hypothetical protein
VGEDVGEETRSTKIPAAGTIDERIDEHFVTTGDTSGMKQLQASVVKPAQTAIGRPKCFQVEMSE